MKSADPLEGRERARNLDDLARQAGEAGYCNIPAVKEFLQSAYDLGRRSLEQERWISVEERLPDVSVEDVELVLGAMPGAVYCSLFRKDTGRFHYLGKDAGPITGITHWQPLPKAPAPPVHKGDS